MVQFTRGTHKGQMTSMQKIPTAQLEVFRESFSSTIFPILNTSQKFYSEALRSRLFYLRVGLDECKVHSSVLAWCGQVALQT